jgi:iron complex outermembrane recepter protein
MCSASWAAFGRGFGVYAQGKRSGDLINSFELPSDLRADALLQYLEGMRDRNRVIPGAPFSLSGTISIEL